VLLTFFSSSNFSEAEAHMHLHGLQATVHLQGAAKAEKQLGANSIHTDHIWN
jgi:hypothetical protein